MSEIIIEIPELYPWVMVVAIVNVLQCLMVAFVYTVRVRGRIFNKEFMNKHFKEIHGRTFGTDPPGGGFPDNGMGYYSKKLDYKDWFEFNSAQRLHINYLE